jgi:hypothetical protein
MWGWLVMDNNRIHDSCRIGGAAEEFVRTRLSMPAVGATPYGHTFLENGPGAFLSLAVRRGGAVVAVIRRPVILIVAIRFVYGVLRLVSCRIDECKGLAQLRLLLCMSLSGGPQPI